MPDTTTPIAPADPAELARFDDKKVCVMNCGQTTNDPRSDKELRFLCDDCLLPNTPDDRPSVRSI